MNLSIFNNEQIKQLFPAPSSILQRNGQCIVRCNHKALAQISKTFRGSNIWKGGTAPPLHLPPPAYIYSVRANALNMGDASCCDRIGNNFSELGKWWGCFYFVSSYDVEKCCRQVWQNILLGQILSLILSAANVLSHHINSGSTQVVPTSQSFPHYMFLCAIYTSWLAFRRGDKGLITIIKVRGWRYLLLCLIDVQANTLMSTAHQFTTLTSIQVRGCSLLMRSILTITLNKRLSVAGLRRNSCSIGAELPGAWCSLSHGAHFCYFSLSDGSRVPCVGQHWGYQSRW